MEKNNSHLAGEYFVAAELNRREFTVGLTSGNAKVIDILAVKDGRHISVQVKAMKNKSSNCPIQGVANGVIYVFVNLNCNKDGFAPPEYYICTAEETEHIITKHPSRKVVYLHALKKGDFKDRWDKVK